MSDRLDILAVLRAPLENYPPSLNQMQLLAEQGRRIAVIDLAPVSQAGYGLWSHPGVRRLRVGRYGGIESLPRRLANHLAFSRSVRRAIRAARPKVVIAYDPNAIAAVGLPDAFNVWHFHELFDPRGEGGPLTRRAIAFAHAHATRADMLIFPDAGRAEAFGHATGRAIEAEVVFNCPRRLDVLPNDRLRPALAARGVRVDGPIVLFQGWIGPSRCIEPVIASMAEWPTDARLVLIGPVKDEYRDALVALAAETGVVERVVILGRVPYAELLGYTTGADIGLSIVSERAERNLSWKYTAGAINKRFEYMAVGLPQIANHGRGMAALIQDSGAGALVDPQDAGAIGRSIAALLADSDARRGMAARARTAHLDRFCYETQFAPVLRRLGTVLDKADRG
jgi:glycosyltransferase involved in cell wall biosynthesis